jgi:hypothetical protein
MIKITLLIIMMIFSFALAPMINVKGEEKYNLPEKVCPDYDGQWDDQKEICKIEDEEEKAAYEEYICEEPEDSDRYPKICKPWLFED